jgi:2-methylisocitrate lyase-like PEP mutase family enzyme
MSRMPNPELCRRFRELHLRDEIFVMPNPWDIGSARLLASLRFEALATTSAGLAWSLGKHDQQVTRTELVDHVRALAAAADLPLNVDSERCFAEDTRGIAETVGLLAEAGAAGLSIEDWNPGTKAIDEIGIAAERVEAAARAAHARPEPMVLTARAENHLYRAGDLDDTIARLAAYRDAGADVVYAPGLSSLDDIARVVDEVGLPVNVLALPSGPSVAALAAIGVRRVSTGGALARAAYGALVASARELLTEGTSAYAAAGVSRADLSAAFG